jgi:RNA polymerase sigma-70 factor (ECF subfamily)
MERLKQELPEIPDEKEERELCKCFRRLLPLVPEQYRELLEEVDLKGGEPEEVAAKLGLTRNNVTVRLHRARKHMRKALTANCGACSAHGCLDCTCGEPNQEAHCH